MKKILLLCCFIALAWGGFAQQQTVTGKVVDGSDETPLPGVSILVKGTSRGTVTDTNGSFSIEASAENVLVFSFIGFETQELVVGAQTTMNLKLAASTKQLSEVIVIGYGEREKKDVTGAISSVNSDEIGKSNSFSTPELSMQGRMAGVLVSTPSGDPTARPTIQIRGVGTFGFSGPLYVIDGIPVYEGGQASQDAGLQDVRSPINIMTTINPNDIESISVLKDASASAIYGMRASNGVILITTKKGKIGKPKVEFSAQEGIQNVVSQYHMLNTQQYTALYNEAYANANQTANLPAELNSADPKYLGNSPAYDWQSKLLNKNARTRDYSLRVSGGSETTTYSLSGGYSKTEGSLIHNYLERSSLSSNVTTKVSQYIEAGMDLKLSYTNNKNNTGSDLPYVTTAPPWQPIYDPNDVTGYAPSVTGTFAPNPDFDLALLNPGPKFNFATGPDFLWGPATRGNVFATQNLTTSTYGILRTLGNVYLQIEPIKGLKFRGTLSGDYSDNLRKQWSNYDSWRFSQTPGNPYSGHDGSAVGSYGERDSKNTNLIKQFNINYNHTFGNHNVDLLANVSEQNQTWDMKDASTGQVNSTDPNLRIVNNLPPFSATFTRSFPQVLQSYMGRLSYRFKDIYYLDGTVRSDGSSMFAPGRKWGTFPSFAAGWRITSEEFFKNLNITQINDLKFRGGWGQLGNNGTISPEVFPYLSTVSTSPDYPLGSGLGNPYGTQIGGISLPNFPNYELTWERVETSNFGFDATLFNNHLNFTAEYYSRYTKGIIQNVSLPPNTGIQASVAQNIGNTRNSGIELQLGYNTRIGAVTFNASGNFTTVKNRVITLYQHTPIYLSNGNRVQEGQSIGYIYGYKSDGIFQNAEDITNWTTAGYSDQVGAGSPEPGDIRFKDINGDPAPGQFLNPVPDNVVNFNDQTYLGQTIPGYYYGMSLGAGYKNFDVYLFFQGIGDVQKYNYARAGGEGMSSTGANQWNTTLNRWTSDHPSNTMPRAIYNDPNANNRQSDRFVESGAFMRFKNFQIGYNFPTSLLSKTKAVQNIRLFVSGTNIFTVTKYKGIDPENDVSPPTRQLLVGLKASF